MPPSSSSQPSGQYCTFWVDDLYFGVDVMEVQEVIRYQEMTEVPLAPAVVRGLINLRGQIVTAIDLRRRLGLPARDDLPMNVVVRSGEEPVSLLVDEIGDVVETDPADREDVPPTLRGPARELLAATYKLPGRLLLVLDTARAVAVDPSRSPERTPEGALS
ncbi:MAG: chemotaxis protein CheW [Motilibacteraceae bacterium]